MAANPHVEGTCDCRSWDICQAASLKYDGWDYPPNDDGSEDDGPS